MKLLWVGDAVAHTGFATVTHSVLDHLRIKMDVVVLGINYDGDPHSYPYQIYPAGIAHNGKKDMWGISRIVDIMRREQPDAVLINNDPWNVAIFVDLWRQAEVDLPMIAYMPVDATDMDPTRTLFLNLDDNGRGLSLAIWYTMFAQREAEKAGWGGESVVIPHGIDLSDFYPIDKTEARVEAYGEWAADPNLFIVGNVNRNQFRKRQDLTIDYFAAWAYKYGTVNQSMLYLHADAKGDGDGWELTPLATRSRINMLTANKTSTKGFSRDAMKRVYSTFDVQISTTMGEGWGLTTAEGLACGVPQIVPDFAALGEWTRGLSGVRRVPVYESLIYPKVNTRASAPKKDEFVQAIQDAYEGKLKAKPKELLRDEWRWFNIAEQFEECIKGVVANQPARQAVAVP